MEPFLRFVSFLSRIMVVLTMPIFWLIGKITGKTVPPITNEILFISAKKLAGKIRRRELKSEDVVKLYIVRINVVNPLINVVVDQRFSEALLEAKAADAYLDSIQHKIEEMEKVRREQPLLGVPFSIKESLGFKGMSLVVGSLARVGMKAKETSPPVVYLMKAGAIPLCLTSTPEYCFYWETSTLAFGRSKNPYNTAFTVGGSSGGEGALLGSGGSLIGVGTDLVGSVRYPSYLSGVFGHKPTQYATLCDHHFPNFETSVQAFLVCGPMARYSEDLPLMLQIMSGTKAENLQLHEPVDLKSLHIYYLEELEPSLTLTPVENDVKDCIKKAAKYLQSCGAVLHEEKFPMEDTLEVVLSIMLNTGHLPPIINGENQKNDKLGLEFLKTIFGRSKYSKFALMLTLIVMFKGFVPLSKKPYYEARLEQIRTNILTTLKDNGVLLMPTFPSSTFHHNSFIFRMNSIAYLGIINILGFPSTTIPMGLNSKKLPIGFQVIATPWNDRLCLTVAQHLEKRFRGWHPPNS